MVQGEKGAKTVAMPMFRYMYSSKEKVVKQLHETKNRWRLMFLLAQSVLRTHGKSRPQMIRLYVAATSRVNGSSVVPAGSSRYTINSQPYDAIGDISETSIISSASNSYIV